MLLKPGFLIRNRYLIIRPIAHGGISATYEAIDKRSRQRVVLKQAQTSYLNNGCIAETFEREANLLVRMRHAVLPRAEEYFVDPAGQFLVMEYIAGDDLWTTMHQRSGQPFALAEVLHWADQLLDALNYLHSNKQPVLHRDIKPRNLKLTPRGDIMLTDLGLAKGTSEDSFLNSPYRLMLQYVAPEQLRGVSDDTRSDLYALAATLYYLLTSEAFPNALERALALSLGYADPLRTADILNPHVPAAIAAVLHQAMAHIPTERFVSAAEMRAALSEKHTARAVVVSQRGGGDYRTISEALQQAKPGMRILVRPGCYTEGLVLDKPVSIIGEGLPEEIIIESTDSACITMQTASAEVRGLFLLGRSVNPERKFFAVDIAQGTLLLENCSITCESLACVSIHGVAANPTIRRCTIYGGAQAGIDIYDQGCGVIEHCEIFDNARAGIEISNGGNPTIQHCSIRNGQASGIYVGHDGQGSIEECDIFGNMRSGISICWNSNPTIRHCTIRQGAGAGIFVYKHGRGIIEACNIFGNAAAGIEIKDSGNPVVRNCTIRDGSSSGVYVHNGGAGTIQDCAIFGNTHPGIVITSSGAPRIRGCQIYNGKQEGIWVADQATGILEQCDIHDNALSNIAIGPGGAPLIHHCHIHHGREIGILVREGGSGRVEDSTIMGHTLSGIVIETRGTLSVLRCRISQNGGQGVSLLRNSAGLIQACNLRDNSRGPWYIEGRHLVREVDNVE